MALIQKSCPVEVRNGCLHVLGLVAAARKDDERVNRLFDELFLNTGEPQFLLQHTSINIKHGEWLLGQQRIGQLWHMAPDDLKVLELILGWSMLIGDYFRGQDIRQQLLKLNRPDQAAIPTAQADWLEFVQSQGLERIEYMKRWELALHTIQKAGVRPQGTAICRGIDKSLSVRFQCDTTVDQLVEIDFAIADAIVDAFDDPLSRFITFSTIKAHGRKTH